MELNRDQIVKALECCSSSDCVSACESGCPYWGGAYDTCPCNDDPNFIVKKALSLIKELTEENERLRAENAKYEAENHAEFNKWLKLEEATKRHHAELFEDAKIAVKEETVREMQDRFNRVFGGMDATQVLLRRTFDQIAKEMLESKDENT